MKNIKDRMQASLFDDEDAINAIREERKKKKYYNSYQRSIIYEPQTYSQTSVNALYDDTRFNMLERKIKSKNFAKDVEKFLLYASTRFIDFDFEKIADFYASADKETQEIFEELGLVIVDIGKAVEFGFTELNKKILRLYNEENVLSNE